MALGPVEAVHGDKSSAATRERGGRRGSLSRYRGRPCILRMASNGATNDDENPIPSEGPKSQGPRESKHWLVFSEHIAEELRQGTAFSGPPDDVFEQGAAYPAPFEIGSNDEGDFRRVRIKKYEIGDAKDGACCVDGSEGDTFERAAETGKEMVKADRPRRCEAHPDVVHVELLDEQFAARLVGMLQFPGGDAMTHALGGRASSSALPVTAAPSGR